MSENIVEETGSEIAVSADTLGSELANMNKGTVNLYSSVKAVDFPSRVKVLSAINNSTPLADSLGKPIELVDIVIQSVDMANEKTGEIKAQPRITLIDAAGKSYHVISPVVYKDIKNLIGVLGAPHTWPAPVKVQAENGKAAVGKFITLKVVL